MDLIHDHWRRTSLSPKKYFVVVFRARQAEEAFAHAERQDFADVTFHRDLVLFGFALDIPDCLTDCLIL
jgi:hypothetical protein